MEVPYFASKISPKLPFGLAQHLVIARRGSSANSTAVSELPSLSSSISPSGDSKKVQYRSMGSTMQIC